MFWMANYKNPEIGIRDIYIFNVPFSSFGFILRNYFLSNKFIYIFHGAFDLERESRWKNFEPANISVPLLTKIRRWMVIKLYFLIQLFVLRRMNKILVHSKYSYNLVTSHFNINTDKVIRFNIPLIKSGVTALNSNENIVLRKKSENKIIFLYASRFEPRKGAHILLEAISLLKRNTDIPFIVYMLGDIDDGVYQSYLYKQIMDFDIFENVNIKRSVSRSELFKWYSYADCVLMPSLTLETLGMITLESLNMGTPVIGFNSGATPEILSISPITRKLLARHLTAVSYMNRMKWFMNLNSSEISKLKLACKDLSRLYFYHKPNVEQILESL